MIMVSNSCLLVALVAVLVVVITTAEDCKYCQPGSNCWPTLQHLSDLNTTLDGDIITAENPIYKYVLIDFSLNCKSGNFNIHIWAWFGYFIS